MKSLLFVYNPHSGKGQIGTKLSEIINIFTKAGYEVTAYPTQRALDGYDRVCLADGKYDLIVCSGGDGTINEVISASMMHTINKTPIGYIPSGSTNDYANALGIPKKMLDAAKMIASSEATSIDVGIFNKRFFNYIAAFGLFTEVSYSTPQKVKNVLGHQAYVFESIKSLSQTKKQKMNIRCNDISFSGEYIYGMVSNSNSVGGFKNVMTNDVVLNDGLFEVTLVKAPRTPLDVQQIVAGMFSKNHKSPMVERIKTNHIVFESEKSVAWTLDGENGDEHQRVEISVMPKAVEIIANLK